VLGSPGQRERIEAVLRLSFRLLLVLAYDRLWLPSDV